MLPNSTSQAFHSSPIIEHEWQTIYRIIKLSPYNYSTTLNYHSYSRDSLYSTASWNYYHNESTLLKYTSKVSYIFQFLWWTIVLMLTHQILYLKPVSIVDRTWQTIYKIIKLLQLLATITKFHWTVTVTSIPHYVILPHKTPSADKWTNYHLEFQQPLSFTSTLHSRCDTFYIHPENQLLRVS